MQARKETKYLNHSRKSSLHSDTSTDKPNTVKKVKSSTNLSDSSDEKLMTQISQLQKDSILRKYNKEIDMSKLLPISTIYSAYKRIKKNVNRTRTHKSMKLSERFEANIYLKRVPPQFF